MKHLRHLTEPMSSGSVNNEVANYHIITYDDTTEEVNYYKKQGNNIAVDPKVRKKHSYFGMGVFSFL